MFVSPIYIETQYAWYILRSPSKQYAPLWEQFYFLRRLAQLVISNALENSQWNYTQFSEKILDAYDDLLGAIPTKKDIKSLLNSDVFSLQMAVDALASDSPELSHLYNNPIISVLLEHSSQAGSSAAATNAAHHHPLITIPHHAPTRFGVNNLDLAVLRPENQERTHITPLINQLASNPVYFRERLQVIGPQPMPINPQEVIQKNNKLFQRLLQICGVFHNSARRNLLFPKGAAVEHGSNYWKCVHIGDILYKVSFYDLDYRI